MANIMVTGTGNANLIFGRKSGQGSGDNGDCIFWAIYGVTTNAEIESALEIGKVVCLNYEHNIYTLEYRSDAYRHVFVSFDGPVLKQVYCAANDWSADSVGLTTDTENNIILWADYGETSSQEIYDACNTAHMLPCVRYSGLEYTLNYLNSSTLCQFITFYNDSIYTITISGNTWVSDQIRIATASDIPTKVSDLTNDAGYITSAHEVPSGGSEGQVLTKSSNADYALTWTTPSEGGSTESSVLIAQYGHTTYTDIYDAVDNRYDVVCRYSLTDGYIYLPLAQYDITTHTFTFAQIVDNHELVTIEISRDDGWFYKPKGREIFWATYGTTTNADIEAAYQAGKTVCVAYNGFIYTLCRRYDSAQHHFSCEYNGHLYELTCESSIWSAHDVSTANLFWATYGTTTSEQIEAAYQAGKMICVKYNNRIYTICYRVDSSEHAFTCFDQGHEYRLTCESSVWYASDRDQSGIFWAEYGVTTSAEIEAAIAAGKLVCLFEGYSVYTLNYDQSALHIHKFYSTSDRGVSTISCINSVWANGGDSVYAQLNSNNKIDAAYLPVYNGGVS